MSTTEAPATAADLTKATSRAYAVLEDFVGPLADSYSSVLESAGRRIANALRDQAVSLAADAKFLPPDEDEVMNSDRLAADLLAKSQGAQRDAAEAVADALAAEGIAFDVEQVFTDELLQAVGERTTFAADVELRGIYRELITEAAQEGWSITRTADAIVTKVEEVAAYRATAFARTDLIGLANGGSVHAATVLAEAAAVYKTWVATMDERTRDTHIDAHGQSVLVNDSFTVGGVHLSYPGDPFGPAEEVINCRCTVIYTSTPGEAVVRADAAPTREVRLPTMLPLPTSALARALPTADLVALERGAVPATHVDVFRHSTTPEQLALMSMLAARATDLSALAVGLEALAAAVATPQPPPVVHVHVPEQQQLAPQVTVQVPEQPAPVVHLAESSPPVVQVDVHVPEQAPPVVNVEVPDPPLRTIEFDRDAQGRIARAEEVA